MCVCVCIHIYTYLDVVYLYVVHICVHSIITHCATNKIRLTEYTHQAYILQMYTHTCENKKKDWQIDKNA